MIETRRPPRDTAPRPGFADELLARLALDGPPPPSTSEIRNVVAAALGGATVALLLARRRRER